MGPRAFGRGRLILPTVGMGTRQISDLCGNGAGAH